VPKPNKTLTPREVEICERAHFARKEIAKWSQPDLATALRITQNQLAGVEYKRAPLRYQMAIFLCERFNISQRWLALGVLPMQPKYDVRMEYSYMVKPDSLFSSVFDGWLDEPTQRIEQAVIEMVGEESFRAGKFDDAVFSNFSPSDSTPPQAMAFYVKKLINLRLNWLPDDLQLMYGKTLLQADKSFQSKHQGKIAKLVAPAERKFLNPSAHVGSVKSEKQVLLDTYPTLVDKEGVPKQIQIQSLPELLSWLRRETGQRGKKAQLARELKVSRQALDQWLAGDTKPSAEIIFELLKRVNPAQGKQK